ncbi:V-type ATPase 116kDa subunit family protein [Porphyromonadaceae bacterium W3.11]|nr:V-type ATPase 116kDa subunit family protein [Porphyromonadaceae bacterium W3.11]
MKRYSYFVFEPEYQDFLRQLRELGVVQVKNRTNTKDVELFKSNLEKQESIRKFQQHLTMIQKSNPLEKDQDKEGIPHIELPKNTLTDYDAFMQAYEEVERKISSTQTELSETEMYLSEMRVWGDFDLALVEKLKEAGYYLHFYSVPERYYDEAWEKEYNTQRIQDLGRSIYFVSITQDPIAPKLDNAILQKLPQKTLSQLEVDYNTLEEEKKVLESTRVYLAYNNQILEQEKIKLQEEFSMNNAIIQGERLYEDKLVILEGWVPEDKQSAMENALSNSGIAFIEMEVNSEDDVPIQLKNNRFTRVFEPLVKLFSLPNYSELDPTPYIAPFFMLFFGICFGDSGYGMLVLVVASLLKIKASESLKPILELAQWLGLSGMVIGFLTGSFFGINLVEVPIFVSIKEYFLSQDNMMVISLVLGIIQIIFAKYIGAMKKQKQYGVKMALSSYAWPTLILIGAIMFGLPKMNIVLPTWIEYLLLGIAAISVLLVLFYNSPGKNVFLNIGSALWQTYGTASGLLGDTLSYIRLFAIGLTGSILGSVFNELASTATSGLPIWAAIPVGAFILIAGHSINFGLTTIGALVHPIRLIFVEYFNNSEYEGGGKAYDPLRKLEVNEK